MADDLTELARLREALAVTQHEIWAHWMKYLFSVCREMPMGHMVIPAEKARRWQRQMETTYGDLTEQEKDSDRHQADKIISVLMSAFEGDELGADDIVF